MAAQSALQQNLGTAEDDPEYSTICQPSEGGSNRTRNRESNLAVHRHDNHIQNNGLDRGDQATKTGLEEDIDDSANCNGTGNLEPGRGRGQETTRFEKADVLFLDGVGSSFPPELVGSSLQICSNAAPVSRPELTKSTGTVLGRQNVVPSDQTSIVSLEKIGEEEAKNHPDSLHSAPQTNRAHRIDHPNSMRRKAVKSEEPIEDLARVAVQTFRSKSGIQFAPHGDDSKGPVGDVCQPSAIDESGASAHSSQTTGGDLQMDVGDGVADDGTLRRAVNIDGAQQESQGGGSLQYRPDGADGRHGEDATFHPLEHLRRSRMLGHPKVVFRLARELARAVGPGPTDLDVDIEMQDTENMDAGDDGSQNSVDTGSNNDGDDSQSGSNDQDDSRSSSSGSSDAARASREGSSNHRRHRRSRRNRRSNRMARFERIIRLLCLVIGGIVAIINVVLLFLPTDWNENVVAGDHRQIAKRFSHITTLFML